MRSYHQRLCMPTKKRMAAIPPCLHSSCICCIITSIKLHKARGWAGNDRESLRGRQSKLWCRIEQTQISSLLSRQASIFFVARFQRFGCLLWRRLLRTVTTSVRNTWRKVHIWRGYRQGWQGWYPDLESVWKHVEAMPEWTTILPSAENKRIWQVHSFRSVPCSAAAS